MGKTGRGQQYNKTTGIPSVAQWLTNLTRIHEDAGSIPGLAQWAGALRCRELWSKSKMSLGSRVAVAVV